MGIRMNSKERLYWIIGVLVLIIAIILIVVLRKPGSGSYFKELIATKDSSISQKQKEIDDYIRQISEVNKDISNHELTDSILIQLYLSSQQIHKQLDAKL